MSDVECVLECRSHLFQPSLELTVHLRALGTVGALFFYVLETVDLETPAR